MPGSHGDIDHIAISPTGIYVIDTKDHKGKIKIARPLLGKSKLLINGRDHTQFLDGLDRQIAAVRTSLAGTQHADIPIHGALCFTKVIMAGLRHPRGMKSGLQLSQGARRWLRIRGPCADADFSLVPVSLYQSLAWEPWPEPRTVALSTRYSIAL